MTSQEDKKKKYSWSKSDIRILKVPQNKELEKKILAEQEKRLKERNK